MSEQSFSLIPFPAPALPALTIMGRISFQNNLLSLHYSLAGNIDDVLLPPALLKPSRRNELWKTTCFEFFLAIKGRPQYWEFNMSSSGDWNVYRMEAYRRIGFREETSIRRIPLEIKKNATDFVLDVAVDLNPIIQREQNLEIGVTAVIQTKDGNQTFWALTHPAPQADFHLRESFVLTVAGQTHLSQESSVAG
jgi:hypothetical protein